MDFRRPILCIAVVDVVSRPTAELSDREKYEKQDSIRSGEKPPDGRMLLTLDIIAQSLIPADESKNCMRS